MTHAGCQASLVPVAPTLAYSAKRHVLRPAGAQTRQRGKMPRVAHQPRMRAPMNALPERDATAERLIRSKRYMLCNHATAEL